MKQSNDVITFEVDETLYFESGQEIAEMISISLDPEISIQTYDNYIQVRGLIILQGEYIKAEESPTETEPFTNELTGYVEKVVDTEGNQAKFTHRFPVEISVPPYRVDNLEDVTVTIDSFDYELPDEGKLKIKSAVHINGIKQDVPMEDKQNVDDEAVSHEAETQTSVSEQEIADVEFVEQQDVKKEVDHKKEFVKEVEHIETGKNEIDIQLNESEVEEEEEVKDVRFLTDLFGSKEEETYTTMRIYIAQEDDTIETIAKRYEVSALQLVKDNNLSGESIEEGQLLQLPVQTN